MQTATGAKTQREAAEAIGVDRSTISRWLKSGMPMSTLSDLIIRFDCDQIEATVVWGYLKDECVPKLNYAELVKYAPSEVLAEEIRLRLRDDGDSIRKTSVRMLRRA